MEIIFLTCHFASFFFSRGSSFWIIAGMRKTGVTVLRNIMLCFHSAEPVEPVESIMQELF